MTSDTAPLDYYALLNVPRQAKGDEIKNAYRRLCLLYHPDKQLDPDKKHTAQKIFHKIHTAYTVLNDPQLRNIYDELGMEGVEAAWQVGPYLGKDMLHLREAIERIRRERLLASLKSKTVLSAGVDASMAFVDWSPIIDQVRWFDLTPSLSSLAITHRIEGALLDGAAHGTMTLSVASKSGSGSGMLTGTLRRQLSPKLQGRVEFAAGRQRRLGTGLTLALSQRTSLDTLVHSTLYGGAFTSGYQVSLSRLWGNLDVTGDHPANVWSTSLSFLRDPSTTYGLALTLSRHHHISPLSLSLHLSSGEDLLALGLHGKLCHQVDPRHTIKVRFSSSAPVQFALSLTRRATDHPHNPHKSSLTIEAGSAFGVGLKLSHSYGDVSFILPIYISRELSSHSFFLGAAIPSLVALLTYNLILLPYQRWTQQQAWHHLAAEQELLIRERQQEAHLTIDLMSPFYQRKRESEQAANGLVIIAATYEIASPLGSPLQPSQLPPTGSLDVTIPLQVAVVDSQLVLADGTKSSLLGFYNVAVGKPKVLRIDYLFRSERHSAIFADLDPVLLPLRRHRHPASPASAGEGEGQRGSD